MDHRQRHTHLPKYHAPRSPSRVSQMVHFKLPTLSPTRSSRKSNSRRSHWSRVDDGSAAFDCEALRSISSKAVVATPQPKLLAVIPQDIIQDVFLHLEVPDVLSLAQVSRLFRSIAQSTDIWRGLALRMLLRGRHVALYRSLSLSEAPMSELRDAVVTASAAEAVWLRSKPRSVGNGEAKHFVLEDVDLDHASYVMKFTSHTHLVLPTKGGRLVGWDMRTGERAGEYLMGADTVLINVQGDYATRSLYWILGKMSSEVDQEQNLQLKLIRIRFPDPPASRTTSKTEPLIFEDLMNLVTPWSLAAEIHILDAAQRMFCAVFEHETSGTTGIHVVLDWEKGQSFLYDTGIPYVYGRSVTGLQLSEDKKLLILRSEQWGSEERRAFSVEHMRNHSRHWNSIRSLGKRELAVLDPVASMTCKWEHDRAMFSDHSMTPHTVWVLPQYWPTIPGIPRLTSTIVLFFSCQETSFGTVRRWCAAQHYTSVVESGLDGKNSKVDLDGAPCSAVRNVIEMKNPVLISLGHHGLPILAQSFNHLGWIEEAEEQSESEEENSGSRIGRLLDSFRPRSMLSRVRNRFMGRRAPVESGGEERRRPKGRQLKLVTFPDPGSSPVSSFCTKHIHQSSTSRSSTISLSIANDSEIFVDRLIDSVSDHDSEENDCDCTTLKPVTLDVPSHVLDKTYHMFLDSAAGSLTLATEDNELHEYRYGRARPLADT